MKQNTMKKAHRGSFKFSPVTSALLAVLTAQVPANLAHANAAFGGNTDVAGNPIDVPTYYATSPQGVQPAYDPATHALSLPVSKGGKGLTVDTGTPIRKFVDTLGGVYNGLENLPGATDLAAGIPVAITEKWVNPLTGVQTSDDYYEIGIVEYTEQLHSDLAKPTRLRGYVQIETPAIAKGLKDITGLIGSEHIPAQYPDGAPIYRMKPNPAKQGDWIPDTTQQVYFVHKPHYLGPVILAAKGTPVRMKATNYLPYTNSSGVSVGSWNKMGGELAVPVDESIAGGGPVLKADGTPQRDQFGQPIKMAQNRAAIHWHGGDTPWISDGTPHQWFAPAGDISYTLGDVLHPVKSTTNPSGVGMGKGDSCADVPDMPASGDGSYTLYFPNNLSGRLMMYHDHTSGLTKVNVYEGMAAGYVVYDPVELTMVANAIGTTLGATLGGSGPFASLPTGLLDSVGIPIVIQDKTFVPKNIGPTAVASDGTTPASQDAKWDLTHWGHEGDFFFPHVYETNQDPNSADGTNPVGRWDWGPWFWPVFPAQRSLPSGNYGDVNATPEAFMDTPIVNGQAYPTMSVDPKTYRFRILSVANDRTQNLGLYQAVDANGVVCDANNTSPAVGTPMPGGALLAACTEVKMVPAVPTIGFPARWPNDGRVGGVPDPATAGPDIVQIGSEGGLLPAPVILKSQPVTYDQNVRNITVFNILDHDLLLGGGERADVLVDFSRYAGHTLILYNDAPAPMPGFDPRIDYFTGAGDQTAAGGAFDTLPGYGPNTRTIMQIKVNNTPPAPALDVNKLAQALPAAYAATQPAPIIPEVAYNAPFGTQNINNYAAIGTGSGAINSGKFTYTEVDGNGQSTTKQLSVINKAIQELFDPIFGRMNATLAVELPFSTATVATTIPLAYIDTPVERLDAIADGETQIWKITHNGVDGHPVHFHLVNVQVINRVGWDGTIKPPEANELGWKETLRMNPLEDVYVAVKAVHPVVPFGLPTSNRLLDPSQVQNSGLNFTNIDPTTGLSPANQTYLVNGVMTLMQTPAGVYSNQLTGFDNEYVWHCHILGHEENDFMRPFIFHPNVVVPDMPTLTSAPGAATLTWTDPTPVTYSVVNNVLTRSGVDSQGIPTAGTVAGLGAAQYAVEPYSNPKNEIGFKIIQNTNLTTTVSAYTNAITTTTVTQVGNGRPATKRVNSTVNVAATNVTTSSSGVIKTTPANVTSWTGSMPSAGADVSQTVSKITVTSTPVVTTSGNTTTTVTVATTTPKHATTSKVAYTYGVVAYNAKGNSTPGVPVSQTLPPAVGTAAVSTAAPALTGAAAPSGLGVTAVAGNGATLSWIAVAGATSYLVNGTIASPTCNTTTGVCTAAVSGLIAGNNSYSVQATTLSGTTTAATINIYNGAAEVPVALTWTGSSATAIDGLPGSSVSLTWANNPLNVNNVTGLTLSWARAGATIGSRTFTPDTTGSTVVGLAAGTYDFTLVANSPNGNTAAAPITVVTP